MSIISLIQNIHEIWDTRTRPIKTGREEGKEAQINGAQNTFKNRKRILSKPKEQHVYISTSILQNRMKYSEPKNLHIPCNTQTPVSLEAHSASTY